MIVLLFFFFSPLHSSESESTIGIFAISSFYESKTIYAPITIGMPLQTNSQFLIQTSADPKIRRTNLIGFKLSDGSEIYHRIPKDPQTYILIKPPTVSHPRATIMRKKE